MVGLYRRQRRENWQIYCIHLHMELFRTRSITFAILCSIFYSQFFVFALAWTFFILSTISFTRSISNLYSKKKMFDPATEKLPIDSRVIPQAVPYGAKVDVFSLGILCFRYHSSLTNWDLMLLPFPKRSPMCTADLSPASKPPKNRDDDGCAFQNCHRRTPVT